ncbi:MAG: tRNA (adenosine(37)-N6)-threonylcarbamoyltransferase complex dimerization subunit type 1 TsaB [Rikenellaceae bacterium]|jgi:tRNA threonylcarbamoyladenosine biosynthesis protein TsaB|nr:tRNA (adenosine(37)-N6)-threonylcarbamoyltransferase complex dimerization subunit type 1 TsaB [Rikenellaceae bacterium]
MSMILNIETGTEVCSVALTENGRLISLRESGTGRQHARQLALYIDEIFRELDIDPHDLDAIAVGQGPGSYTGLRIGVSLAKGLSYGLGIPLIAVSTLGSMARVALEDFEAGVLELHHPDRLYLCPMIDARRMEVYAQVFDQALHPVTEVEAVIVDGTSYATLAAEREFVIFGSGAQKCADVMTMPNVHYVEVAHSARGMAAFSDRAFQQGDFVDTAYFEPFYLKDFVVTTSAKKLF